MLACAVAGSSVLPAAAQAPAPAASPAATPSPDAVVRTVTFNMLDASVGLNGSSRAEVVGRILSFDANGDDRVTRDELPDRMSDLVGRGDVDQDGFLSAAEVTVLVEKRSAAPVERFSIQTKAFTLADVISDLRLAKPTHDVVMELVKNFSNIRVVNNSRHLGQLELSKYLRDLLTDEEYENYEAAAARMRGGSMFVVGQAVR
jgi:hypothetical protein